MQGALSDGQGVRAVRELVSSRVRVRVLCIDTELFRNIYRELVELDHDLLSRRCRQEPPALVVDAGSIQSAGGSLHVVAAALGRVERRQWAVVGGLQLYRNMRATSATTTTGQGEPSAHPGNSVGYFQVQPHELG